MTNGRTSARRLFAAWAGVVLAMILIAAVPAVAQQVRMTVPDESPGGPYYARLEYGYVHQTDEWVAIAFYRDPDCVRANFNLLNFFDAPGAFSCALTIHGFEIRNKPVDPMEPPRQARYEGNGAVPVWFVSVADFNAAAGDGRVRISELRVMPSLLRGLATLFEETLHPAGGAKRSMIRIVAHGDLPDGRRFDYVAVEANGVLQHVGIMFW